jgi:hypothetical protein
MTEDTGPVFPQEFGRDWHHFHREWCLGEALALSPHCVASAVDAVARHTPEKITAVASGSERGPSVICPLIELGDLFLTVENARYFPRVLKRLKSGNRSAYSEIVVVSALIRSGFEAIFEAGKGRPDAVATVDGTQVAFEVYAPERGNLSETRAELLHDLEVALKRTLTNCRVEVDVLNAQRADVGKLVEAARAAPSSEWVKVGNLGRVRRVDQGPPLSRTFDGDGPEIVIAGQTTTQGSGFNAVIRIQDDDLRARDKLEAKRAQISANLANVVVINVTNVGGIAEWPALLSAAMGSDFEKIGAVLFFDQGLYGGPPVAIRRRWRALLNRSASLAVPERLLTRFEALGYRPDDIPVLPRLIVA